MVPCGMYKRSVIVMIEKTDKINIDIRNEVRQRYETNSFFHRFL